VLNERTKKAIEKEYPAIMDRHDVAKLLRISDRTLYRLMSEGALTAWKDEDAQWNFARKDIIDYLDRNSII
jgi:excisionase family DNA binding protein